MATLDHLELDLGLDEFRETLPDRTRVGLTPGADVRAVRDGLPPRLAAGQVWADCTRRAKMVGPLLAADVLSLAASGLFAHGVVRLLAPHAPEVIRPESVVLALLIGVYAFCGLYSGFGVHPVIELRQLIQLNTLSFAAAAVAGLLAPPLPVWCVAAWVASVLLVPFVRALVRRWCAGQSWWGHPTLIIGSAQSAEPVTLTLMRVPTSGLRPVAVTDPDSRCRSDVVRVINDPAALEQFVRAQRIRYAVVALPELPASGLSAVYERYTRLVPHLLVLSDSTALPSLWGRSRSFGRLNAVEMRNGRMLSTLLLVKRAIDLAVAAAALLAALPLMAGVSLMVKLTSRGPIFFGHKRIGFSGRWFKAWKFRTMYPNGDALLEDYFQKNPSAREEWEVHHKLKDDPRVTPVGRFLRKTSLDELPQIWNVLRGEMSLVGPRPIVADEVEKYGNVFRVITTVKPGITGLWQVSGRNDCSYPERVRLDQYYVANWSPWLDLYILGKTVWILVRRNGAY